MEIHKSGLRKRKQPEVEKQTDDVKPNVGKSEVEEECKAIEPVGKPPKKKKVIKFEDQTKAALTKIEEKRRKIINTVGKLTKKKENKTLEDQDKIIQQLETLIRKTIDDIDELKRDYKILEGSHLKNLKRLYLNHYFRRMMAKNTSHVGQGGVYNYSQETISPYNDSIFN